MVAEELRELYGALGIRTVNERDVGRSDLLEVNRAVSFWKAQGLDFSKILYRPTAHLWTRRYAPPQDHGLEKALDQADFKEGWMLCAGMDARRPSAGSA
jgi:glutamate synthase (NADPH) large chain